MTKTFEMRIGFEINRTSPAGLVKGIIASLGYPWTDIIEMEKSGERVLCLYFQTKSKALGFERKLRGLIKTGLRVHLKSLLPRDWESKWKDDFRAFDIGRSFRVVPLWEKEQFQPQRRTPIFIDTGLAFGTGLHATTRYMIEFIERCRGRFETFLDLGTGTGILAVAAYHCGARGPLGVDICGDAVRTARRNCRLNLARGARVFKADLHSLKMDESFDFVAANLITHDLIKARRTIVGLVNAGGFLAFSGVSSRHYEDVRRAYRPFPLRCLKVEKGEGWTACLLRKE
jgi:ribosomal protein L11 methyltransferase